MHDDSILDRANIRKRYVERLQGNENAPDELYTKVIEEVEPFKAHAELDDIKTEFRNIQRRFSQHPGSEEHLEEVLRWAMDHTSVRFTKRCLHAMA